MASTNINYIYTTDTIPNSGQTEYTFTATEPLICDILIVAGGGAGGIYGGGGGAGGLIYLTNLKIRSGNYIVKVGKGGAIGNNGSNSSFDTHIAIGGGRGADQNGASQDVSVDRSGESGDRSGESGRSGGSGGGGSTSEGENNAYRTEGGQNIINQGNSGGRGTAYYSGGGGGGAGGVGVDGGDGPNNGPGGNGGIGKQYNITNTPTYYAGGGGGFVYDEPKASGGLGGGGNGGRGFIIYDGINSENGIPNTGGGGGGGENGSSGGSGIVIIKFIVDTAAKLIECENNSNLFNTVTCQQYCTNIPDNCNASFKEFCNKTENKQACLDFCNKTENKQACLKIITTNCKDKQTSLFCQNTGLLVPILETSTDILPRSGPGPGPGPGPESRSQTQAQILAPTQILATTQEQTQALTLESILKNYKLLGLIGLIGLLFLFLIIYIWRN
jgi:hypothetical protein